MRSLGMHTNEARRPFRVLVVGDDPLAVRVLDAYLRDNGAEVVTALGLGEGVQLLAERTGRTDAVMVALAAPEACRLLRQAGPGRPFCLVTRPGSPARALPPGYCATLAMPFTPEALGSCVAALRVAGERRYGVEGWTDEDAVGDPSDAA